MQTICRFSGVPLISSNLFPKLFPAISQHPIFNLPLAKIVARTGSFQEFISRPLPEQSLLTIAIATKLELLSFSGEDSTPAVPSAHIPATCFPLLIKIAQGKIANSSLLSTDWPALRVTSESANLEALPAMLKEIADMPRVAASTAKLTELLDAMESKVTLLSKLKNSGDGAAARAVQRVSTRYALAITAEQQKREKLSPEILELWEKLLLTTPEWAHRYELADIEELQEFMVSHLPHGNDACFEVLKHCRAMYDARANPTINMLSRMGSKVSLGDFLVAELVSTKAASAASDSPEASESKEELPVPKQEDYPSKVSYLVALAQWRAAQ